MTCECHCLFSKIFKKRTAPGEHGDKQWIFGRGDNNHRGIYKNYVVSLQPQNRRRNPREEGNIKYNYFLQWQIRKQYC